MPPQASLCVIFVSTDYKFCLCPPHADRDLCETLTLAVVVVVREIVGRRGKQVGGKLMSTLFFWMANLQNGKLFSVIEKKVLALICLPSICTFQDENVFGKESFVIN